MTTSDPPFFPVCGAHVWPARLARANAPPTRFALGAAASDGPRSLRAPGGPPIPLFFPVSAVPPLGPRWRPRLAGTPDAWKRSPEAICARGSRFRRPREFADTPGPPIPLFFSVSAVPPLGFGWRPRLAGTPGAWKRSPEKIVVFSLFLLFTVRNPPVFPLTVKTRVDLASVNRTVKTWQ